MRKSASMKLKDARKKAAPKAQSVAMAKRFLKRHKA